MGKHMENKTKKRKNVSMLEKRQREGYFYILPWIIGFLVLQIFPIGMSLYYSFTDFNFGTEVGFVGLNNYIKIFTKDKEVLNSLKITIKYVLMSVPMKLISALLIAMLLNQGLKGINFYRTLYYLPSIMGGSVAIAILWRQLFAVDGAVNKVLNLFGIKSIGFLTDPNVALVTISMLSVWQFGSSMIFFLSALKQVPQELYEAARIDGAGKISSFFQITLPMISPMTLFNLIMQMINAFQEYTAPAVITGGGPMKRTKVLAMTLYETSFSQRRMGYASAISWVMFAIIIVLTVIIFATSDRWTYYNDER